MTLELGHRPEGSVDDDSARGVFSPIDVHFARFLCRAAARPSADLFLAAALVSQRRREGDVCVDLTKVASRPLAGDDVAVIMPRCPDLAAWRQTLLESEAVAEPGSFAPLVLDASSRLYFYRLWEAETELAKQLTARAAAAPHNLDDDFVEKALLRLFGPPHGTAAAQHHAARVALRRRLCVISGGPGSGKTYTASRILALILEDSMRAGSRPRVVVAAPTGKAAARLRESMREARPTLGLPAEVEELFPSEAVTLHRLLGARPDSRTFRANRERRLRADVVVVDEASMVDLVLMARLVEALEPEARLILLGDRDQLASVEAGMVLGDIAPMGRPEPSAARQAEVTPTGPRPSEAPIAECFAFLEGSRRFASESGIAMLSRAVRDGDAEHALELLRGRSHPEIEWVEAPRAGAVREALSARIVAGYEPYLRAADPAAALAAFERCRVLCTLRHGPTGVSATNEIAASALRRSGLVPPTGKWYDGLPVLVRRNDPTLRLFNGDVGIVVTNPHSRDDPRVFFPDAEAGALRSISPARLPPWDPAFAMTVHQSQGSEFDAVLLVLPPAPTLVVSRELIYTALTRARRNAVVIGRGDVFLEAVRRRTERHSGLRDALWGGGEGLRRQPVSG